MLDNIINYPLKQIHKTGIISFILSIIGLFGSFLFSIAIGIVGIISSHIAKSDINANSKNYDGKRLVTAGLIINYIVILFSFLFVLIFGASFAFSLNLMIK